MLIRRAHPRLFVPPFVGGVFPVLTALGATIDTSNATNYSHTGVSFGVASSGRYLYFLAGGQSSATTTRTISSATIGGVTATVLAEIGDSGFGDTHCALIAAAVPTGTSGTVAINYSGSCLNNAIYGWAITELKNPLTPEATSTDTDSPIDVDVNTLRDGIVIGGVFSDQNLAFTTTGLTEDYDNTVDTSRRFAAASASGVSPETPRNVSFSQGFSDIVCGLAVSLR